MNDIASPLQFDDEGRCECCRRALERMPYVFFPDQSGQEKLTTLVQQLKDEGTKQPYDCIIGLSGGIDSAYLAHFVRTRLNLRPLAVHVDGGWNTEPAVRNIETLVRSLNIDLYTHVVEWGEMRDLQVSFLRAGVLNQDIPQDHAFFSSLLRVARKFRIRTFLSGVNFATECVSPGNLSYPWVDGYHIRAIQRRFGTVPLSDYRTIHLPEYIWRTRMTSRPRIRTPLNHIPYSKNAALDTLRKNYSWADYGTKHSESRFTKFYQDIYLPRKFHFDKRRLHYSSLIVSGQMTRAHAVELLQVPALSPLEARHEIKFIAKKLNLSSHELDSILNCEPVEHISYPNHLWMIRGIDYIRNTARQSLSGFKR